jgi:hypothetical protein
MGAEAFEVALKPDQPKKSESKAGHIRMSRLIKPENKDPEPKK